jgi:uncharacterized protein (UPF0335 family)
MKADTNNPILRDHFDVVIELLLEKAKLNAKFVEWRQEAKSAGLDARALFKLGREHLRDEAQRRKAAEQAEVEELYRRGLGLPLFECAMAA